MSKILRRFALAALILLAIKHGQKLGLPFYPVNTRNGDAVDIDIPQVHDVGDEVLEDDENIRSGTNSGRANSPTNPEEIKATIIREFEVLGREAVDWALRVAFCESTFNPLADNGTSCGLYQYLPATWEGSWNPYRDYSIWDWRAQVKATAVAYQLGKQGWWVCK